MGILVCVVWPLMPTLGVLPCHQPGAVAWGASLEACQGHQLSAGGGPILWVTLVAGGGQGTTLEGDWAGCVLRGMLGGWQG